MMRVETRYSDDSEMNVHPICSMYGIFAVPTFFDLFHTWREFLLDMSWIYTPRMPVKTKKFETCFRIGILY